ncbi:hypothetical protein BDZ89DRAFT_1130281 [Hymenopellis radicata]|nr:hypothetical protein BDZ89DRAFT_1130281 [Hymenopellis radicata]
MPSQLELEREANRAVFEDLFDILRLQFCPQNVGPPDPQPCSRATCKGKDTIVQRFFGVTNMICEPSHRQYYKLWSYFQCCTICGDIRLPVGVTLPRAAFDLPIVQDVLAERKRLRDAAAAAAAARRLKKATSTPKKKKPAATPSSSQSSKSTTSQKRTSRLPPDTSSPAPRSSPCPPPKASSRTKTSYSSATPSNSEATKRAFKVAVGWDNDDEDAPRLKKARIEEELEEVIDLTDDAPFEHGSGKGKGKESTAAFKKGAKVHILVWLKAEHVVHVFVPATVTGTLCLAEPSVRLAFARAGAELSGDFLRYDIEKQRWVGIAVDGTLEALTRGAIAMKKMGVQIGDESWEEWVDEIIQA